METEMEKSQILRLENRENFTVGMVENVENFSDTQVVLKTAFGGLFIFGSDLKLEDLSMDTGNISVTGKIDKLEFTKIKEKRSFFRDMFR